MLLERSFELIISQLAILKVGAAYVPLDIKAPLERQAYIVSDSGAKLLITDERTKIPAALNAPVLRLCAEDLGRAQGNYTLFPLLNSNRSLSSKSEQALTYFYFCPSSRYIRKIFTTIMLRVDTAYVMYTSGSTGRPKGVMVHHRGIARFVINNGFAAIGMEDRVAFVSNTAFDHTSYEVWAPSTQWCSHRHH